MSSWYVGRAPEDDIAVSCRVRLARNISGLPFLSKMYFLSYTIAYIYIFLKTERKAFADFTYAATIQPNTPDLMTLHTESL